MKKSFLASLLMVLCVSFVQASIFKNGDGKLVVKNYDVANYHAIHLNWAIKIVINNNTDITPLRDKSFVEGPKVFNWMQGEKSSVSIKTDENIISYIKVEVSEDGVLSIGVQDDYFIRATNLEINATCLQLDDLSVKGNIETHLLSPINNETFSIQMQSVGKLFAEQGIAVKKGKIEMDGNGQMNISNLKSDEISVKVAAKSVLTIQNIEAGTMNVSNLGWSETNIAGKCEEFTCFVSGKSVVNAQSLVANEVKCTVEERGKAKINAENSINMKASGRGNIEYIGNATQKTMEKQDFGKIKRGK